MTLIESLISGAVQGLTEFLPVSSSGHLVLVHSFFGMEDPEIFFDICLHFATLGAVLVFFRKDIIALFTRSGSRMIPYIAAATIPAFAAGLLLEKRIESFFASPAMVSLMLIVTALILLAGQLALARMDGKGKAPGFLSSVTVGVAQAFALIPGISRSGITVSAGLCSGVNVEDSFRFSFLISIPVIAGATLYKIVSGGAGEMRSGDLYAYAAGMATAFIFGLLGLRFLLKALRSYKLWVFIVYCLLLGLAGLIMWK